MWSLITQQASFASQLQGDKRLHPTVQAFFNLLSAVCLLMFHANANHMAKPRVSVQGDYLRAWIKEPLVQQPTTQIAWQETV